MGQTEFLVRKSELTAGFGTIVKREGQVLAVFLVDDEVYAIDNTCPHQGAPLAKGFVDGNFVYCPLHDWCFDVTTGEAPGFPGVSVTSYPLQVIGDEVHLVTGE